ncbi:MAG TPA: RnfABCDGE type electron transport complex subunit A [Oscillospiraceae bacterium]|nr:RnfABCDGE type electron transport complex subunit A [Oscillospiraceae bacterium]HNW04825.1 RnfABCDGE type electron transport complex subunit A [Oscillospiraceae bacterium]
MAKEYLALILGCILVNNVVLAQFMGICPFLGVSRKMDSAVGMGIAVTFVLVMATAATWPFQMYLLVPRGMGYLETLSFILIIAALVQLVEIIMKKYTPALHRQLGVYLPLITTNCAVLGITLTNIDKSYGYVQSLVNAFGTGLGFLLAMILFNGVRSRIDSAEGIPDALKGIPSALIAASLVSMGFMGFAGLIEGIFG